MTFKSNEITVLRLNTETELIVASFFSKDYIDNLWHNIKIHKVPLSTGATKHKNNYVFIVGCL
ncbi:MAG: hypothetical protein H7844_13440 [Nitrospirae bacterium YQR-1]